MLQWRTVHECSIGEPIANIGVVTSAIVQHHHLAMKILLILESLNKWMNFFLYHNIQVDNHEVCTL